jgi:hypothetical protein
MSKILILAANPKGTNSLRLDKEVREIQAALERAKRRDEFEVMSRWAVRTKDLRQSLLNLNPQIVHFSGHGAGNDGLVLENDSGQVQLVSSGALARLFGLFQDSLECVLLNACYSEVQAEAIHQHIGCVIGMNQAIGDRAAIEFAVGFYEALGAGRSYEDAFNFGRNAIDVEGIQEVETPALMLRNLTNTPMTMPSIPIAYPEGFVPVNSSFYAERPPTEAECYEQILKPRALIRIRAPHKMGKSSLIFRITDYAKQQGCQTVIFNLRLVDDEFLTDSDRFLQWFCASVTDDLGLPNRVAEYWNGMTGSKNKCTKYFERYLLRQFDNPIVLALDDVDQIFPYGDIAKNFFSLLRTWHERQEELWQNLRLIMAHSQEAYIPLGVDQSPFNVGFPVELQELSVAQVKDLLKRHGLQEIVNQTEQMMKFIGGHPYLVRMALYEITCQRMTLEDFVKIAPTEQGLYRDHLRRHYRNLESNQDLLAALNRVVSSNKPVQIGSTEAFRLHSMGLVKYQGNSVMPLCELYRQYFLVRLNP